MARGQSRRGDGRNRSELHGTNGGDREPTEIPAAVLRAARAEFGLEVDEGARLVFVDGDRRSLSRLEFDALVLLLRRPDLARSYLELLHRLWHPDYGNARNVVHQVMWRLRDELRSAGGVIENVRGFGYRASPVLLRRARRRLST